MTNPSNTEGEKNMGKATCKTCGGTPNHHIPSMFDPEGIGDPGHKMSTPHPLSSKDNIEELKDTIRNLMENFSIAIEDKKIAEAERCVNDVVALLNHSNAQTALEVRNQALEDAKAAIDKLNIIDPYGRQCWYAVDKLIPKSYRVATLQSPQKGTAE